MSLRFNNLKCPFTQEWLKANLVDIGLMFLNEFENVESYHGDDMKSIYIKPRSVKVT